MSGFIGRDRELAALNRLLGQVKRGGRADRPGRAVLIRGRRRVGKSRLVEEFLERTESPHVFFTASAQPNRDMDLRLFAEAVLASDLPDADIFQDQTPRTWDAALRLLARALPRDRPSVVVLDELPYLIANDPGLEGTLQKTFDRELSRLPALLVGIGSDLAMMTALNAYGRPFHQRATEMVVPPLTPADTAEMLELAPADAFDSYLVTGGLPLVLDEWPPGLAALDYVSDAVTDPTSALLVSGERTLAAEFPTESQARHVLTAIGTGERTFSTIARAAGHMPQATLTRALHLLADKGIVAATTPLSSRPSRETRYSIADPHLRFWLAFLGPHLPDIERGRGDLVARRVTASWPAWRGTAIEPVVREALRRLPEKLPAETQAVGGYWTRSNDPEIDLVGADREPVAKHVTFVGSIKWKDNRPFDHHDLSELVVHRSKLPGADDSTPLLAVARAGTTAEGVAVLGPEDLIAAW